MSENEIEKEVTPVDVLKKYRIPTNNVCRAVQAIRKHQYSTQMYDRITSELLKIEVLSEDQIRSRLLCEYAAQEVIKAGCQETIDTLNVFERFRNYVEKHPWVVKDYEEDMTEEEIAKTGGSPLRTQRSKKGQKQEQCEFLFQSMKEKHSKDEIITAFIEQADMTPKGATTYFYNCKKKLGFSKVSHKKQTRMEMARQIWKRETNHDKAHIMEVFQKEINTTLLGSQTYYYACKKESESK